MRRIVLTSLAGALAAGLSLVSATPATAASKTVCERGSGSYAGRCYTQKSAVVKKVKIVDAVPLINNSSKTASMHCSFSEAVRRDVTLGGSASVTAAAEASFLKIASASVSTTYTLSASVSMSKEQSKSAGASVTLKPRQKVVCQRIYSYVTFSVQPYDYRGTKIYKGTTKSVTVPSTLGVRIVD